MRLNEAEWIAQVLDPMPSEAISPLLELGSQTLEYRTVQKPYIEEVLHRPLRNKGVRIVTTDLQDAPGVDISGDIFNFQVQEKLHEVEANLILCSGILPVVSDYKKFAAICNSLVKPGHYLVVTTAQSYPFTPDPIDNGFRPTPEDIAALFPGYEVIKSATLISDTYLDELRQTKRPVRTLLGVLARTALFRGGWEATKCRGLRLMWMFRPFTVSAMLLRKPEAVSPSKVAKKSAVQGTV